MKKQETVSNCESAVAVPPDLKTVMAQPKHQCSFPGPCAATHVVSQPAIKGLSGFGVSVCKGRVHRTSMSRLSKECITSFLQDYSHMRPHRNAVVSNSGPQQDMHKADSIRYSANHIQA